MASRTANFCIDAADPWAQAQWWARVVDDFELDPEHSEDEAGLSNASGRQLLFLRVPEPKTVKNRMHLCLRPVDMTRDEEVERIVALGATMADDRRGAEGWAVLADPEGNEFCVLNAPADTVGVTLD